MFRTKAMLGVSLCLLITVLLPRTAAPRSGRAASLEEGAAKEGVVRTVYFVEGMSCRACTMILDRNLEKKEGVFWARFNYPLRLFTVYHDPAVATVADLEGFVDQHEELDVVVMGSRPAAELLSRGGDVARWTGGSFSLEEAAALPTRFKEGLDDYMLDEGTSEWFQVVYEIAGEAVRNRILQKIAAENGYDGKEGTALPFVVSKDFYWPSDRLEPTREESAMARYIHEKIVMGEEGKKGAELFDAWLMKLYGELEFIFLGESMELGDRKQ
jgi:copper chaperone CopZ